jgi:hypothetical protein
MSSGAFGLDPVEAGLDDFEYRAATHDAVDAS